MNVLIFEPDHTGHHFLHLGLLIPHLNALGAKVTVATTGPARETKPYQVYLSPLESTTAIDAWMPPMATGFREIARQKLEWFQESVRRSKPDWACVPYADGLAQMLGVARTTLRPTIPGGVETEGLMMRGVFAYPSTGLKQRFMSELSWALVKRSPLRRCFILDPIVYNAVQRRCGAFARRCALMPEPMDPPPAIEQRPARVKLRIPEDGRYIGCVGLIDRRKGCDLLIHAFARAKLGPTDRLLLVGGHEKEIKELLERDYADLLRAGRIVSIDRFVDPDELGAALRAMDLVCTPYPRHIGSASIVIRAAAAGRPVVGSTFGWVKWAIDRFSLGRTCDVENIEELAGVLRESLDSSAGYRLTSAAQRWVTFHTPDNFASTWTARVRERMGKPPAVTHYTWDWVERG